MGVIRYDLIIRDAAGFTPAAGGTAGDPVDGAVDLTGAGGGRGDSRRRDDIIGRGDGRSKVDVSQRRRSCRRSNVGLLGKALEVSGGW